MNFQVMAKPAGPACNLRCTYCFYTEKENLFRKSSRYQMSEEVLERFTKQYITSQSGEQINFAWQGGEPTLLGLDYFKQVVALLDAYDFIIETHASGTNIEGELEAILKAVGEIHEVIARELEREDMLDEQVKDILKEKLNEIRNANIDYYEMFKMVKAKLAEKEDIIL